MFSHETNKKKYTSPNMCWDDIVEMFRPARLTCPGFTYHGYSYVTSDVYDVYMEMKKMSSSGKGVFPVVLGVESKIDTMCRFINDIINNSKTKRTYQMITGDSSPNLKSRFCRAGEISLVLPENSHNNIVYDNATIDVNTIKIKQIKVNRNFVIYYNGDMYMLQPSIVTGDTMIKLAVYPIVQNCRITTKISDAPKYGSVNLLKFNNIICGLHIARGDE